MLHVDIRTAAHLLRMTPTALYKRIHQNKLPYFSDGRHYWIPLQTIAEELGKKVEDIVEMIRSQEKLVPLDINVPEISQ